MSGDFYPTHHRGPPRRWYASRRARTHPPRALALRREQARVRESWVLAGRRSGTHTQSANFLSVHWRGLACACRGAARCSHKRGKLTGTQMSEFTRSLSCYPAPLSSQLDTNKRGNVSLSHSPSVQKPLCSTPLRSSSLMPPLYHAIQFYRSLLSALLSPSLTNYVQYLCSASFVTQAHCFCPFRVLSFHSRVTRSSLAS